MILPKRHRAGRNGLTFKPKLKTCHFTAVFYPITIDDGIKRFTFQQIFCLQLSVDDRKQFYTMDSLLNVTQSCASCQDYFPSFNTFCNICSHCRLRTLAQQKFSLHCYSTSSFLMQKCNDTFILALLHAVVQCCVCFHVVIGAAAATISFFGYIKTILKYSGTQIHLRIVFIRGNPQYILTNFLPITGIV